MIQRVMPDLMGMKNILAGTTRRTTATGKSLTQRGRGFEGRRKEGSGEEQRAARLWISGLEAVNRKPASPA
jgi:type III restriction enzyme